jgi:hypothetical protein
LKRHTANSAFLTIGYHGKGFFEQSGGMVSVDNRIFIGSGGGEGTYSLLAGTLQVGSESAPGPMIVGSVGKGEFRQISGNVTVTRDLTLGWQAGSEGKYFLKDGNLTVGGSGVSSRLTVGNYGTGSFEQQGGEVSALAGLQVGNSHVYDPGVTGNYLLVGGNLTVGQAASPANMYIGRTGTGSFEQRGGAVTSYGNLFVGYGVGKGTYSLIDGTLTVGQAGSPRDLQIGYPGNDALFSQKGGMATVYGNLKVDATGTFTQTGGTFTAASADNQGQMTIDGTSGVPLSTNLGDMTNGGAIKVTNTSVTFANYTGSGSYISDPATTVVLGNLVIEPTGFLVGGNGDLWKVGNDFLNTSTQNTAWNTTKAALQFFQSTGQDNQHSLQVPGLDKGPAVAGSLDNFAWGILDLNGQELFLLDYGEEGGALYLRSLAGLLFDEKDPLHILNIDNPLGLNLYYDPVFSAELRGLTYTLDGGGELRPVIPGPVIPIPGSVWLMLSGLAGLGALRWRRN